MNQINNNDRGFEKCEFLPLTLKEANILIDVFDTFFICFPKDIDNQQRLTLYNEISTLRSRLED